MQKKGPYGKMKKSKVIERFPKRPKSTTIHHRPQKGEKNTMPKNLRYDNRNACCVPYDSPPPGLTAQLQRLVTEERPGACVGCGFEHNCRRDGCAVLRKISRIVAAAGKRGTTS